MTSTNIETLLTTLYQAPLNPFRWRDFIDGIGELMPTDGGHFEFRSAGLVDRFFAGPPPVETTRAAPPGADADPIAASPTLTAFNLSRPPDDAAASSCADGWRFGAAPGTGAGADGGAAFQAVFFGSVARYHAVLPIADAEREAGSLTLYRRREQGPFSDAEAGLLSSLGPHIQRAARMHLRIQAQQRRSAMAFAALDTLEDALLVVDAARHVHYANRAVARLLEVSPYLAIREHRLQASSRAAEQALAATIESACAAGARDPAVVRISPWSDSACFSVHAAPLVLDDERGRERPPLAMVLLSCDARLHPPQRELLMGVCRLSQAEAELAMLMARGDSVEEAAHARATSVQTARVQLQRVFEKAGVHRQPQLMRLLSSIPAVRDEP